MSDHSVLNRIRMTATRWRGTLAAASLAALCELGARMGLPGVDGKVVHDFVSAGPGGPIRLYDFLAGGGIARGALLALGVIPYVQARVYVWAARALFPSFRRL